MSEPDEKNKSSTEAHKEVLNEVNSRIAEIDELIESLKDRREELVRELDKSSSVADTVNDVTSSGITDGNNGADKDKPKRT